MPTEALNKAWILTFTDLVSLLLTFFVMLFAMATPPVLTTGPEISLVQGLPTARTATLTQSFPKRSVNLDYLYHVLLDQPIEIEKARLHLDSDKLVLSSTVNDEIKDRIKSARCEISENKVFNVIKPDKQSKHE